MGVAPSSTVLVVGAGGREHALAHALSKSPSRPRLLSYPGNPGIHELAPSLSVDNNSPEAITAAAIEAEVDLVVVGPELYLEAGIVDTCSQAGLRTFGPTRAAARIETSKSWAKQVMEQAGVPTAAYRRVEQDSELEKHIHALPGPFVVKADGIAAGKGVLVTKDPEEAIAFGAGYLRRGGAVVVEEMLEGEEVSVFAFVSAEDVVPLGCARDYKRAHDGNQGPNTGGMGAVSPPYLSAGFLDEVVDTIFRPVAKVMKKLGSPFSGILYGGLMLTQRGPYVVEFNARFGDPETQVLLPRLQSDLLGILDATAQGSLAGLSVELDEQHACGVTIASEGYPASRASGTAPRVKIGLLPPDSVLYHAGTGYLSGEDIGIAATGGRVFTAVGLGTTLDQARESAYTCASQVQFDGAWYRTDIGA